MLGQTKTRTFTGSSVPSIFCWTKMGAEAGQSLDDILRRKDLERQCGRGVFAWGIGNSVGPAIHYARTQVAIDELFALFTPMKSAPKLIDSAPSQILMWTSYYTSENGTSTLPAHMLVTSRGSAGSGSEKRTHYALFCQSEESLLDQTGLGAIDQHAVCNLISSNPVGASQVTSVVRHDDRLATTPTYPVRFKARLTQSGFVRLADPIVLSGRLLDLYRAVCTASSADEWRERIAQLRSIAMSERRDLEVQPAFAF
ncbi:hypothetical protein KK141_17280 [Dyella sp. LX-66]|uniref:hypothetical protein n=1 Tax=unclassified Dyella TaxID=2634549 RepID=UPI001BE0B6EA|nr:MULTISPECIES: hypothetical protein [unclassified Dyella]MBT2117787.1 hypothetical protein [Dyella sp. LX-1]MBT2141302.1 hypothetical protein [Dyella sp. LX-66]